MVWFLVFPSEQAYRRFQRRVDRLCFLIVATDISERDVRIERLFLRTEVTRLFPERVPFYQMLYESRFDRLLKQFPRQGSELRPAAALARNPVG